MSDYFGIAENETTGKRIYSQRKKVINPDTGKTYTQAEFGDILKVSRQTVSYWENDEGIPSLEKLQTIAKLLDCDVAYLLLDQDEPHRYEADIKAVTGLSADTIQALAELKKGATSGTYYEPVAQEKLDIINYFLISLLSESDNKLLECMQGIISSRSDLIKLTRKKDKIEKMPLEKLLEYMDKNSQRYDPDIDLKIYEKTKTYKMWILDLYYELLKAVENIDLR